MNESAQDQPRKIRPAVLAGLLIFFILLSAGATFAIYQRTLNRAPVKNDAQASPLTPLGENLNNILPKTNQEVKNNGKNAATPSQKIPPNSPVPSYKPPVRQPTAKPVQQPALIYACDPDGSCGVYHEPKEKGCPKTYTDVLCSQECSKPEVRCKI